MRDWGGRRLLARLQCYAVGLVGSDGGTRRPVDGVQRYRPGAMRCSRPSTPGTGQFNWRRPPRPQAVAGSEISKLSELSAASRGSSTRCAHCRPGAGANAHVWPPNLREAAQSTAPMRVVSTASSGPAEVRTTARSRARQHRYPGCRSPRCSAGLALDDRAMCAGRDRGRGRGGSSW